MMAKMRSWLFWLAALWTLIVATPSASQATFAYDCPRQAMDAYENLGKPVSTCDNTGTLLTCGSKNQMFGPRAHFGAGTELLAAETTVAEQGRNALGQFTSKVGGQAAPGSTAVSDFIQNATQNGWSLVDREVSFNTPFGMRIYDAVLTVNGSVPSILVFRISQLPNGRRQASWPAQNLYFPNVATARSHG